MWGQSLFIFFLTNFPPILFRKLSSFYSQLWSFKKLSPSVQSYCNFMMCFTQMRILVEATSPQVRATTWNKETKCNTFITFMWTLYINLFIIIYIIIYSIFHSEKFCLPLPMCWRLSFHFCCVGSSFPLTLCLYTDFSVSVLSIMFVSANAIITVTPNVAQ